MTDLSSYSIADFVPFTAEVYFRLIERVSETWWPLHLLTLAAGLAAAGLAGSARARSAGGLMAAALAWVSANFLLTGYARLNWAGSWLGWAFLLAAALLLLSVLTRPALTPHPPSQSPASEPRCRERVPRFAGLVLTALGVPVYPLIAPLAGRDWSRAEVFGIHPDPTAVATLGVVLLTLRGWRLWLTAIVPLMWCLISALTLQVLQAPSPGLLYAAFAIALCAMLWRGLILRKVSSVESPP